MNEDWSYPKRMNPEYKEAFVKALRSGFYEQGLGALRTYKGKGKSCWCALGVLLLVYIKKTKAKHQWVFNTVRQSYMLHIQTETGDWQVYASIPATIAREMGLSHDAHEWILDMNDREQLGFPEIAELVEHGL